MYWIVGLALLAGAIYGGFRLVTWPGFALRTVEVSGVHRTTREDVVHQAALHVGSNLWLMDLTAARNRVQALPFVRTATLVRVPPSTATIAVVERTPDGCLVGRGGQHALIDSDGRILSRDCTAQPSPEFRVAMVAVPTPGNFVQDEGSAASRATRVPSQATGTCSTPTPTTDSEKSTRCCRTALWSSSAPRETSRRRRASSSRFFASSPAGTRPLPRSICERRELPLSGFGRSRRRRP